MTYPIVLTCLFLSCKKSTY